jgi:hypothetical protein
MGRTGSTLELDEAHKGFIGNPQRKWLLVRPRLTWEDNINTYLTEIGGGGVTQSRDRLEVLVNTFMNSRFLQNAGMGISCENEQLLASQEGQSICICSHGAVWCGGKAPYLHSGGAWMELRTKHRQLRLSMVFLSPSRQMMG